MKEAKGNTLTNSCKGNLWRWHHWTHYFENVSTSLHPPRYRRWPRETDFEIIVTGTMATWLPKITLFGDKSFSTPSMGNTSDRERANQLARASVTFLAVIKDAQKIVDSYGENTIDEILNILKVIALSVKRQGFPLYPPSQLWTVLAKLASNKLAFRFKISRRNAGWSAHEKRTKTRCA